MKKIFTLIAMALVAMSVSAKEAIDFTVIDGFSYGTAFSLGAWDWKGVILAEGEPVQNTDAKTADDSNVKYYDASAYDYVVVKYSASTIDVSLIAQYKCLGTIGQWGTEFAQGQSTINASSEPTYAALALDAAQKNTINQIAIQAGGTAGTITIDEVYFATSEEWEAVKPKPTQTKDMMASVKGISGVTVNDDGTVTCTATDAWHWFGMWLGNFDASAFDYAVLELAQPSDITAQLAIQHNSGDDVSGQIPAGETLLKLKLSENKNSIKQMALQNATPGSFTVKAFYFATQEYVDNMAKPETQILPLSDLSSGWNADYDATTHTITITGEEGGGKGWWLSSADYSDFDNVVVEFDPAVTADWGKLVVEYAADGVEASEAEFYTGATCVVVALDAANKNAVMQIYIMGDAGATYTLKSAYLAVASATPEAQPGTAGVEAVEMNSTTHTARYNLAGQKVSESYKGVVIMNGKKFMVK